MMSAHETKTPHTLKQLQSALQLAYLLDYLPRYLLSWSDRTQGLFQRPLAIPF